MELAQIAEETEEEEMTRDMHRDGVGYQIVIQTTERAIERNQKIIRGHESRIRVHKESILALRKDIDQETFKKIEAKKALEKSDT